MLYRIYADIRKYMYFSIDSFEILEKMEDFNVRSFGSSQEGIWNTPDGNFLVGDEGSVAIPDISQWVPNTLVFNEKSKAIVEEKLKPYGEFLDVKCEGISYFLFNAMHYLDDSCVNTEKSEILFEGDIWMGVKKMVFNEEKVESADPAIFKTTFDRGINLYCTDAFKLIIEGAGLHGLVFSEELTADY